MFYSSKCHGCVIGAWNHVFGRCGHCKALAPEFEDTAIAYKRAGNVVIAKVDTPFVVCMKWHHKKAEC